MKEYKNLANKGLDVDVGPLGWTSFFIVFPLLFSFLLFILCLFLLYSKQLTWCHSRELIYDLFLLTLWQPSVAPLAGILQRLDNQPHNATTQPLYLAYRPLDPSFLCFGISSIRHLGSLPCHLSISDPPRDTTHHPPQKELFCNQDDH